MKKLMAILLMGAIPMLLFSQPPPLFDNPQVDRFWVALTGNQELIEPLSGGIADDPGEDGMWYYYPNPDGPQPWFNIWFWNGEFKPMNTKNIMVGFWAMALEPAPVGSINIVVNWDTPEWAWPPPQGIPSPPLPPFSPPELESQYVMRSDPVNYFEVFPELTWYEFWYIVGEYNPDWVSIDVMGADFIIPDFQPEPPIDSPLFPFWDPTLPGGIIVHECIPPPPDSYDTEFGDAPDQSLAYIDGSIGNFPTCIMANPNDYNDYISHPCPNPVFFGGYIDCEGDGNAGWCPYFNPGKFNMDECGTFPYPADPAGLIDEGLMIPIPLNIVGPIGAEYYMPCGSQTMPLGNVCRTAVWGQNIDMWIDAASAAPGQDVYFHLLIDWNQDGVWANDPGTTCNGQMVPELVILNHPISIPERGPMSQLQSSPPLPDFQIGPYEGYVWARFSITEAPVIDTWDGHGQFQVGETEDYILQVADTSQEIPIGTWPIILAALLIAIFTVIFWRRRLG